MYVWTYKSNMFVTWGGSPTFFRSDHGQITGLLLLLLSILSVLYYSARNVRSKWPLEMFAQNGRSKCPLKMSINKILKSICRYVKILSRAFFAFLTQPPPYEDRSQMLEKPQSIPELSLIVTLFQFTLEK